MFILIGRERINMQRRIKIEQFRGMFLRPPIRWEVFFGMSLYASLLKIYESL